MALSNVFSYLLVVILSRSLGPEQFGGYTALASILVLIAVPMSAFQVVVARQPAHHAPGSPSTTATALAALTGTVIALLVTLTAPVTADLLHLDGVAPLILVGLTAIPMMLAGCYQGALLSINRVRTVAGVFALAGVARLAAAVIAGVFDQQLTGIFALTFVAWSLPALVAWLACRDRLRGWSHTGWHLLPVALRSNGTLAAFFALTSIDVILARHFLTQHETGGLALAANFGRAMCWMSQFLAVLIVPRMSRRGSTRALFMATGAVLAIGAAGIAVVSISPGFWIATAGGTEYRAYGSLTLAYTCLGVLWALAQVWLFADVAADGHVLGALTWAVVVAECVAVVYVWHDSAAQIVAVCMVGALVIVAFTVGYFIRNLRRRATSRRARQASPA